MDEEYDDQVRRLKEKYFNKIIAASVFLLLWNKEAKDDWVGAIQLGLAVYFDKPILIVYPQSEEKLLPENLKRLALVIETYDDTLIEGLVHSSFEAACLRLIQRMEELKKKL